MNIFNDYKILSDGTLDIYRKIDISDLLITANYSYYDVQESDNLMSISQQFYQIKDNWWVLYLFNEIYDINFFNLTDTTITNTINNEISNFINYSTLPELDKAKAKASLIDYFNQTNTLKLSIYLASQTLLLSDFTIIDNYKKYINDLLINNSMYVTKLKIPDLSVVYAIKNRMDSYSVTWNS